MNAQMLLLGTSVDKVAKTFTLSVGIVDLDAAGPSVYQTDGQGNPLKSAAGYILAAPQLAFAVPLLDISATYAWGTTAATVLPDLRTKAQAAIAAGQQEAALATLVQPFLNVWVPVTP